MNGIVNENRMSLIKYSYLHYGFPYFNLYVNNDLYKELNKKYVMETLIAIKPGPKSKKEDGTPARRPKVNPPNQPNYSDLKSLSTSHEIQNDECKNINPN